MDELHENRGTFVSDVREGLPDVTRKVTGDVGNKKSSEPKRKKS